jgi:hypothetical protein
VGFLSSKNKLSGTDGLEYCGFSNIQMKICEENVYSKQIKDKTLE